MRAAFFVTFALIAGCTSSWERVQTMREGAPDWYEARKYEIRGEDYPQVVDIPLVTDENRPGDQLELSAAETTAILQAIQGDPRSEPPTEQPEAMRRWAEEIIRAVEGRIPAPDFLTDEDVAALKAIFDTPRARL